MKIVGFAGSNSKNSINKQLVNYTLNQFVEHETVLLDLNDFEMPIYSIDRQLENGFPALADTFYQEIKSADAVIISLAEHNLNFSTALKNILDWVSRIEMNFMEGKKLLLLSTSPGSYGGGNVMSIATKYFEFAQATLVDSYSIPFFQNNFQDGRIIDAEIALQLDVKINQLHQSIQEAVMND